MEHSCRADFASGLAGTLYEYTSILLAESFCGCMGIRSFCPLGGRDGFACGNPLHRWDQRLVHLESRRLCGLYGHMLFTLHFQPIST